MHFFFLRLARHYEKINFDDIRYVEASLNYCKVHLTGKTLLTQITLKHMEQKLPPDHFCRIHRSYIVRMAKIIAFDNRYVDLPGIRLPFSGTYHFELQRRVQIIRSSDHPKVLKEELPHSATMHSPSRNYPNHLPNTIL